MKRIISLLFLVFTALNINAQDDPSKLEKPFKKLSVHTQDVIFLGLTPDWKYGISASRDNTIKLVDPDSGTEIRTFKGHISAVQVVTFSHDMKLMLSGADDGAVILWDATTGNIVQRIHNHTGGVSGVAFSPDEQYKYFYSSGDDGNIQIYDRIQNGKFIHSIKAEGGGIQGMGIPAGSRNLIIACNDGKLREYNKDSLVRTFEGSHSDEIRQLTFSPDGKYAATCSDDKKIIIWDIATGKISKTLEGHEWKIFGVAFNPTSQYVASCSIDGTIRLWNLESGAQVKLWTTKKRKTFNAVTFTPNSKYVLSAIQHTPPLNEDFYWWGTDLNITATPPSYIAMPEEKPAVVTPEKKTTPKAGQKPKAR